MGPVTLFDKSFLEMLNVDEASVFDALYSTVICPIFYTEVLADLSKEPRDERTAERLVVDVAKKTPIMHSTPNVLHSTICLGELLGHEVDMREVPVLAGGRPVRNSDGGVGIIYDQAPEAKTFDRWQSGRFHEIERDFASKWRAQLAASDHGASAKLAKQILAIHSSPKDLAECLAIAKEVVHGEGQRFSTLKTAYVLLGLPKNRFPEIQQRWIEMGRPRLTEFAPYTAHCLLVDIFFYVAVDKKLIDPGRPSNRIDIAYLYYLPFAMIFVSNDKLHRRAAPLFMNDRQIFVFGDELKRDLMALEAYYAARPEHEREEGLFRLAAYPPNDCAYLTTHLYRRFEFPTVRTPEDVVPEHSIPKSAKNKLMKMIEEMQDSARRRVGGQFSDDELQDASHVVIKRKIPQQRGKWRLMPKGFKGAAD
jgi:hypothetical protein